MSKSVIIIDDSKFLVKQIVDFFEKEMGFTVLATGNDGGDAVELFRKYKPDLITLDILMPKKSGLSFFKVLNEELGENRVPVIVLSGLSGHRQFFEDESVKFPTAFVEKPIVPDSFLAKAKEFLGE